MSISMSTKPGGNPVTSGKKPPLAIVIDNCGFSLSRDIYGNIVATPTTGGAGGVALGHAFAALADNREVLYFATPKNDLERELAKDNEQYIFMYNGKPININFIDVPEDTYRIARDEVFSNGLWWRLQRMLDTNYISSLTPRQWQAYCDYNEIVAQVISARLTENDYAGTHVIVHDSHLALVGRFLKDELQRLDLISAFFAHTAFSTAKYLDELARTLGEYASDNKTPLDESDIAFPLNRIFNETWMQADFLSALAQGYDSVVFHTKVWENRFKNCLQLFDIKGGHTSSSMAVVDTEHVKAQFNPTDSQKISELHRIKTQITQEVNGRIVIGVGGRAEPYKNIALVVEAYFELCQSGAIDPRKVMLAVMSSETRAGINSYAQYWINLTKAIETINNALEGEAVILTSAQRYGLSNSNYPVVLSWMSELDILITAPHDDGRVLMIDEAQALQSGCLHVVSKTAGIYQELKELENSGFIISIDPQGILTQFSPHTTRFVPHAPDSAQMQQAILKALKKVNDPDFMSELPAAWEGNKENSEHPQTPRAHLEEIEGSMRVGHRIPTSPAGASLASQALAVLGSHRRNPARNTEADRSL